MIEPVSLLVKIRKYHGLGNDFLVLLDVDGHRWTESGVDGKAAALARAACNRHRGIGADGLLIVSGGPIDGSADVTMRLHNADGSIAEMSGNGIRCFSQAVVDAAIAPSGILRVQTDAGLRVVTVGETNADGVANIRVDMGVAKVDAFEIPAQVQAFVEGLGDSSVRVATVDVGNPHIIVGVDAAIVDVATFDIASFGTQVEKHFMEAFGGINVHVVSRVELPPIESGLGTGLEQSGLSTRLEKSGLGTGLEQSRVDVLAMTIWERGVGITEACGTGATAVAIAAHGWGWVGSICELRQPGGTSRVEIVGEQLTLIGPSQFVATSDFAWHQ